MDTTDKLFYAGFLVFLVGIFLFLGIAMYWTDQVKIACIKSGGSVIENSCIMPGLKSPWNTIL